MNIFKKKLPKYEMYILSGNQGMIDRGLKQAQEDGWELAGSATTYTGNFDYKGMLVPLKRKIK